MACAAEEAAAHRRLRDDLRADDAVRRFTIVAARDHADGRITSSILLEAGRAPVPPSVLGTIADHGFGIVDLTTHMRTPGGGMTRQYVVDVRRAKTR